MPMLSIYRNRMGREPAHPTTSFRQRQQAASPGAEQENLLWMDLMDNPLRHSVNQIIGDIHNNDPTSQAALVCLSRIVTRSAARASMCVFGNRPRDCGGVFSGRNSVAPGDPLNDSAQARYACIHEKQYPRTALAGHPGPGSVHPRHLNAHPQRLNRQRGLVSITQNHTTWDDYGNRGRCTSQRRRAQGKMIAEKHYRSIDARGIREDSPPPNSDGPSGHDAKQSRSIS